MQLPVAKIHGSSKRRLLDKAPAVCYTDATMDKGVWLVSLGTNINRLRMKCGMSQDVLAEKLGRIEDVLLVLLLVYTAAVLRKRMDKREWTKENGQFSLAKS